MNDNNLNNERILPCFLDRLTDQYPKATQESRELRIISIQKYRDSVLRDLQWLLNASAKPVNSEIHDFDHAETSVLNFGIPSISGIWSAEKKAAGIAKNIVKTIKCFEPRILAETLQVIPVKENDANDRSPTKLTFEIIGELWVEPVPEKLFIKTEVDLETGSCQLT